MAKKLNKVVEVLMRRDGDTEEEAKARLKECREQIYEACANGDYEAAEEAIYCELGLELDYIFDII